VAHAAEIVLSAVSFCVVLLCELRSSSSFLYYPVSSRAPVLHHFSVENSKKKGGDAPLRRQTAKSACAFKRTSASTAAVSCAVRQHEHHVNCCGRRCFLSVVSQDRERERTCGKEKSTQHDRINSSIHFSVSLSIYLHLCSLACTGSAV
jgi:hypothetical protein